MNVQPTQGGRSDERRARVKIRHIDFSPDEFLVGVAGMSAEEIGVYWVACCLIYSSGGPIPVDDERLKNLSGVSPQKFPHIIKGLTERRHKLDLRGGLLSNKRAATELARAEHRTRSAIANGRLGGRPRSENNDMSEPGGLASEKLTINHQPSTTNHQPPGGDSVLAKPPDPPAKRTRKSTSDATEAERLEFELFYAEYPLKRAPDDALRVFLKVRRSNRATLDELISAAVRYANDPGRKPEFTKHPATWLNAGCWLDQAAPPPGTGRPVNGNGAHRVVRPQATDPKHRAEMDDLVTRSLAKGPPVS